MTEDLNSSIRSRIGLDFALLEVVRTATLDVPDSPVVAVVAVVVVADFDFDFDVLDVDLL